MMLTKTTFAMVLLLILSVACLAQDKATGAIKGKVRVEQGSPGGVAVILLQGDREVTRAATKAMLDAVERFDGGLFVPAPLDESRHPLLVEALEHHALDSRHPTEIGERGGEGMIRADLRVTVGTHDDERRATPRRRGS